MKDTQHCERAGRQQEQHEPQEDRRQLRDQLESAPTLRLVSVAGHLIAQRFGRIFGEQDGLSPSGAAVLNVIGWAGRGREKEISTGRITHAELARRCMITPATLTGVVSTLVKAGYLRRERDAEDRRVVWLMLTEAGTERVRQLRAQIREIAASVSASLDPEHEAIIREFLVDLACQLSTSDPCFPAGGPLMFDHRGILNKDVGNRTVPNGHREHGDRGEHEGHEGHGDPGGNGHRAVHVAAFHADLTPAGGPDSDSPAPPIPPNPPPAQAPPPAHVSPSADVSAASEPGSTLG